MKRGTKIRTKRKPSTAERLRYTNCQLSFLALLPSPSSKASVARSLHLSSSLRRGASPRSRIASGSVSRFPVVTARPSIRHHAHADTHAYFLGCERGHSTSRTRDTKTRGKRERQARPRTRATSTSVVLAFCTLTDGRKRWILRSFFWSDRRVRLQPASNNRAHGRRKVEEKKHERRSRRTSEERRGQQQQKVTLTSPSPRRSTPLRSGCGTAR